MSGGYLSLLQNTTKEFGRIRTETVPYSSVSPISEREITLSVQEIMYDEWKTVRLAGEMTGWMTGWLNDWLAG